MKRIFGILMIGSIAIGSQAQTVISNELAYINRSINNSISESGIEIYPTVVDETLNIMVDDKLANGKVTVSVFSSLGEIVLEETLGLGLNKLNVTDLAKGNYVAVVRGNGEYKSKSSFEVI